MNNSNMMWAQNLIIGHAFGTGKKSNDRQSVLYIYFHYNWLELLIFYSI